MHAKNAGNLFIAGVVSKCVWTEVGLLYIQLCLAKLWLLHFLQWPTTAKGKSWFSWIQGEDRAGLWLAILTRVSECPPQGSLLNSLVMTAVGYWGIALGRAPCCYLWLPLFSSYSAERVDLPKVPVQPSSKNSLLWGVQCVLCLGKGPLTEGRKAMFSWADKLDCCITWDV